MVNELKKYALSRSETGLTQALTEAEELIEHSVLKSSSRLRQSTLSSVAYYYYLFFCPPG